MNDMEYYDTRMNAQQTEKNRDQEWKPQTVNAILSHSIWHWPDWSWALDWAEQHFTEYKKRGTLNLCNLSVSLIDANSSPLYWTPLTEHQIVFLLVKEVYKSCTTNHSEVQGTAVHGALVLTTVEGPLHSKTKVCQMYSDLKSLKVVLCWDKSVARSLVL